MMSGIASIPDESLRCSELPLGATNGSRRLITHCALGQLATSRTTSELIYSSPLFDD